MKYIKLTLILPLFLLFACEDYLDKSPDMGIDEDEVFGSFTSIRGYLDNCYKSLPDYTQWNFAGMDRTSAACLSDEAASTYGSNVQNVFNVGDWLDKAWTAEIGWADSNQGSASGFPVANAYYCIRIANRLIEKVPGLANITEEERKQLMGQAYFFRAYYHFEIIKRWGGMGYVDKVFYASDNMDIPRLSYQATTDRIIQDLDAALNLLPDKWGDFELGRVTKVGAMAMKSMAELYASSPLMKNDLKTLVNNGYDEARAAKAAEYANEVLTYIDTSMPSKRMMDGSQYKNIFYFEPHFVSQEALWFVNNAGQNRNESISIHFQNIRFSNRQGNYGWAISTPSQNLIDMFEVINPNDNKAYPYNHANSGFTWEKPFENRDPRFYNNILYPGKAHGVDKLGKPLYLEPWVGGSDHQTDWRKTVPSGYMCIKFWWPEANGYNVPGYAKYNYSAMFIRTTQIYLDYSEAMNEAYGPNSDPKGYGMTAVEAINKVRTRVGMPNVLAEFTSTKELFRDRIRNERAVELMYENHRWWDIRRWMIAEALFKDTYPIKGVEVIDLTPAEKDVSKKKLKFSRKDVVTENRVFQLKHYWYPIAKDNVDMLDNTFQNPGW